MVGIKHIISMFQSKMAVLTFIDLNAELWLRKLFALSKASPNFFSVRAFGFYNMFCKQNLAECFSPGFFEPIPINTFF